MAEFVGDCPRCGARKITFDVLGDSVIASTPFRASVELLARCRSCAKSSVASFVLYIDRGLGAAAKDGWLTNTTGIVPDTYTFSQFVTVANGVHRQPPEHLPNAVQNCFTEGASAFSIGAFNAAAAMFRLSLDIATKGLLPEVPAEEGGPNNTQRKRLYERLNYLFENRLISPELRELADCVREDGNDGAHDGTLTRADAEDLIDFAEQLLERVYTEPARLRIAKARREARRAGEGAA